MREIKFRAWNPRKNEYFTISRHIAVGVDGVIRFLEETCTWVDTSFIPEQYIGLKGQDGAEIFAGDIVERELNGCKTKAVVVWINDLCSFMWQSPDSYRAGFTGGNADFFNAKTVKSNIGWTVIGNIHQNPELLER